MQSIFKFLIFFTFSILVITGIVWKNRYDFRYFRARSKKTLWYLIETEDYGVPQKKWISIPMYEFDEDWKILKIEMFLGSKLISNISTNENFKMGKGETSSL